jgi:hypothetical protein
MSTTLLRNVETHERVASMRAGARDASVQPDDRNEVATAEELALVGLNALKHGLFAGVCVDCEHSGRMSVTGTMGPRQFSGLLARDPGHRDGPSNFVTRYSWSGATGQHEHYGKRKQ